MPALLDNIPCDALLAIAEPNKGDVPGKVHDYALAALADKGTDDAAWSLRKLDDGKEYRIGRRGKAWRCNCPAYRFHHSPRGELCKHAEAVRDHLGEKTMTTETKVEAPPAKPANGTAPRMPGSLAKALAKAQQRCKAAAHDARNEFHKYDYTSSEAVISEAKAALAETGLALLPVRLAVKHAGEGHSLDRDFLLLHDSGESHPLEVRDWPVIPDRGRPLDKAVCSADTTSLAYLLRDLLQMPRCDPEDDVAARDDRHHEPAKQQAPAKNGAAPPPAQQQGLRETMGQRLAKKEDALVKEGLCKPGELLAALAQSGKAAGWGSNLDEWPSEGPAFRFAVEVVKRFEAERRGLNRQQMDDLAARLKAANLTWGDLLEGLGLNDVSELTLAHLSSAHKWIEDNSGVPI